MPLNKKVNAQILLYKQESLNATKQKSKCSLNKKR